MMFTLNDKSFLLYQNINSGIHYYELLPKWTTFITEQKIQLAILLSRK